MNISIKDEKCEKSLLEDYHFYINLTKRQSRKIECEKELKKIGIQKPNRFNAIEDKIGSIGCSKSHIKCLEIAKENKWPYVCIFEDDVIFIDPDKVNINLEKYIDYDYDVLYIGAWIRNEKYKILNDDLLKVDYACCTHAYIIKNHYYDTLLNNLNEGLELKKKYPTNGFYNADEYMRRLQEKDNWLCFNPILASQKDGFSDNFNKIRNFEKIIQNIPTHESRLPYISILTPTFNRRNFLPLITYNIQNFRYPKNKIEWLVLDSYGRDGEKGEKLFNTIEEVNGLERFLDIKINYHYIQKKMSIGEKRNWLSKNAKYDLLINMDDDDIYFPNYIIHSVDTLIYNNKDCVASLDMLMVFPRNNFEISILRCINNYQLFDESTMCMKKTHWEKFKYKNTSLAEGQYIYGKSELCTTTDIFYCVMCVCWEGNTYDKSQLEVQRLNLKLNHIHLKILENVLNYKNNNMEPTPDNEINIKSEEIKTIEDSK